MNLLDLFLLKVFYDTQKYKDLIVSLTHSCYSQVDYLITCILHQGSYLS